MPSCAILSCRKRSDISSINRGGISFHRALWLLRRHTLPILSVVLMETLTPVELQLQLQLRTLEHRLRLTQPLKIIPVLETLNPLETRVQLGLFLKELERVLTIFLVVS